MKYAIETHDLVKQYGDFRAVDNLNLFIEKGTIGGILGPNGAGKTTSIKMLTCLIPKTSGEAKVAGFDVTTHPDEVRKKIGMVPQKVSLYNDLTVRENVELCADFYNVDQRIKDKKIDDLLDLVDISYAQDKYVRNLSGGMQQKTSVVASLIHNPELLFLDEPTVGLDPTTKRTLWDLMVELNDNGNTIILCSHDMYEVDKICDSINIINSGKVVAHDTPQGLKDHLLQNREENNNRIKQTIAELQKQEATEENLEQISELKASLTDENEEVTVMVSNITDEMIDAINDLDIVKHVENKGNGRLNIGLKRSETAVNYVITTILSNGGNIASIKTNDPTLEDVFVAITAKKRGEIKDGN
ncbi:MAG: ATP-binding cassette domain-containing protein [Methanosphaera sp.]|uniref:ATP-binding cassette domain-containing protein n=1 Tax=Methanosphaera sp. TaxID=2666342 RepID=UPI0025D285E4|nr:ATP-binding cassette domain-containing protein [Methanosphaera sp.]MCI5867571.1 ATP-binding cassette domain-containing protein [Methanosphaera sp.]MDD6534038.1 ATP-binding cassette domain-containing protein [Methanosphaera sp.]MDY3956152.1 ATP-binding cassette domain-containing protein [Methanosphaera sp.]